MKNLKIFFIWCSLILFPQFSQAQVVDKIKRFEIGGGLNITQKKLRISFASGYWIMPHISTQLFFLSPQSSSILFEPSSLIRLEGGRMEKANLVLGNTFGLNLRLYHRPQNGLFFGFGLSRQSYQVTSKSVFDNDFNLSTRDLLLDILLNAIVGGDYVRKIETYNRTWGINWEFGLTIPAKKGRFEFLIRQNNLFVKDQKYAYQSALDTTIPNIDRAVKSDFDMSALGFEINYIIPLF